MSERERERERVKERATLRALFQHQYVCYGLMFQCLLAQCGKFISVTVVLPNGVLRLLRQPRALLRCGALCHARYSRATRKHAETRGKRRDREAGQAVTVDRLG